MSRDSYTPDKVNDGASSPSENMRETRDSSYFDSLMGNLDQLSTLTLEQKMLVGVFVPQKPK